MYSSCLTGKENKTGPPWYGVYSVDVIWKEWETQRATSNSGVLGQIRSKIESSWVQESFLHSWKIKTGRAGGQAIN